MTNPALSEHPEYLTGSSLAAFGFTSWQRGISSIGANRVLVYQYLVTLTGVVCGVLFFGESLGLNKIVGGIIILLGVYVARRQ